MSKNFLLYTTIITLLFIHFCISQPEKDNTTLTEELLKNVSNDKDVKFEMINDPFKSFNYTNIMILGDSNYTAELKKYDKVYLTFYAPLCMHCVSLMSIFIETADYCKEKYPSVKFAIIDSTSNQNASLGFNILETPTVFFIYQGHIFPFAGLRTKEGFLYFMKRKMTNDVHEITKLAELKNLKNILNTSLIFLNTVKYKDETIYKSFYKYASEAIYAEFATCISNECLKKYGDDIILFKNYDEKENRYFSGYGRLENAKNDSVRDFASIYAIESGAFATQLDLNLAFEFKKPTLYYLRNSSNKNDVKYDPLFKELGKELRFENIYTFVISPDGNEIQRTIYNAFSVAPEDMPGIFYYNPFSNDEINKIQLFSIRHADMKKINIDYLKNFIKDIKSGKIKRDLFTEINPEKEYINGMKYVLGKTYDKDVIEEKNNVFLGMIEGYGNTFETQFMEILGNLTQKYQNDTEKKIKISIMNVEKNEPRDIDVNGYDFPRAYLYTNDMEKKEKIRYTPKNMSNLNIEEFEEFLFEHLKWKNETKKEKVKDKETKDKYEDKKTKTEDL